MHTPPRILRAEIEDIPGAKPILSDREIARQAVILAAGRRVLVNHGRARIRLSDLAVALGMAPGTIRRYFPDLDYLLGEILRRHLLAVSSAIGEGVRGVAPAGRREAARAAYLAATRTVLGNHTEAHLLLVRERHHLPPDLREGIERTREGLGEMLAGEHGMAALGLLDTPELSAIQIEAMLKVLAQPVPGVTGRVDIPARQVRRTPEASGPRAEPAYAGPPGALPGQPYATAGP